MFLGLILPIGNPSRRPGRTGSFHLLLEFLQVDFDQLTETVECPFKLSRGGRVLIFMRLRWPLGRHPLAADNTADAFANRIRQIHVALTQCLIAAERAQDFVLAFLECGRFFKQFFGSVRRLQNRAPDGCQSRR